MDLKARLRELADESGIEAVGVTTAAPFDEVAASIRQRVEKGLNARLAFTYADPDTATRVRRTYRWATSLVVVANSYLPLAGSPQRGAGMGRIARFAVDDPYEALTVAMAPLVDALRAAGAKAEILVDDNRLVDRGAAVRAGIAWWGKNTMAIAPAAGPWLVLGSIVTDAVLEPDRPMVRDCGTCEACLPACPTGALVAPGVLDARRCLAAIAQAPGWIPIEFRKAMGDRIYGCDDCLEACPPGRQRLGIATEARGMVDLVDLVGATDEDIKATYNRFYFPKNDPNFLRRNALVALGNVGSPRQVGAVAACLDHRSPRIRGHAAWALGQIGGEEAIQKLRDAADRERDLQVLEEIRTALG